jgi:hypothetical protein
MANRDHLTALTSDVEAWNKWRSETPDVRPDLRDADLRQAKLAGADLNRAILRGADLTTADLRRADLVGADLHDVNAHRADFSRAYVTRANLRRANLSQANLSDAYLTMADLGEAILSGADIRGSHLTMANLGAANVTAVVYDTASMRGRYLGIRGLESCYGDAIFKRDAADQDFLDTVEERWRGTWRAALFWLWGLIGFGRSLSRVALLAVPIVGLFAAVYTLRPDLLDYSGSAQTWFTPVYYSIVTYTTLGFGDVKPKTLAGEILVAIEVVLGYLTLGLLLAILAQKVARRS